VLKSAAPAVKSATGSGGQAAASGMFFRESTAIAPETVSGKAGAQTPAAASDPITSRAAGAPSPVRTAIPSQVRNILIALAALGLMAPGAALARLIGGGRPGGYACGGFRIELCFSRHPSDRPPFGRASGRRGGKA
jgi:hypothetical protein